MLLGPSADLGLLVRRPFHAPSAPLPFVFIRRKDCSRKDLALAPALLGPIHRSTRGPGITPHTAVEKVEIPRTETRSFVAGRLCYIPFVATMRPEPSHIEHYRHLRSVGRQLITKMYEAAKGPPYDMIKAAKKLTLPTQDRTLLFDVETDVNALADFYLHEMRFGYGSGIHRHNKGIRRSHRWPTSLNCPFSPLTVAGSWSEVL